MLLVHERKEKKIKRLTIRLGALQSIDKDILAFAIRELSKERGIDIEDVELVDEPLLLKCNACRYEWKVEIQEIEENIREAIHFLPEAVYAYFKCPNCNSIDFEIVRGRGLSEVQVETYA